jgi:hypothetical protein
MQPCTDSRSSDRALDLTKEHFPYVTVLGRDRTQKRANPGARWFCRCVCGKVLSVRRDHLRRYRNYSCGCQGKKMQSCPSVATPSNTSPSPDQRPTDRSKNLTGRNFQHLTVLCRDRAPSERKSRAARWLCQCVCGNVISVSSEHLLHRHLNSCGCRRERPDCQREKNYAWKGCGEIHGTVWRELRRGAKERNLEFAITIAEGWALFLAQDRRCALSGQLLHFSLRHKDSLRTASLDRINPDKGYIPGNVQWVHKDLNRMKWDMQQADFLRWCLCVATFQRSQGRQSPSGDFLDSPLNGGDSTN